MELEKGVLKIGRELSELDKKALKFVDVLEEIGVDYVIVSGFVAILAGRSRGTEDVDVLIERLSSEKVKKLTNLLNEKGYWCINLAEEEVYKRLDDGWAVRFAEKDEVIPNFKVRFTEDEFEKEALQGKIKVKINSKELYISPLELQIAYKLHLETEKDFEDALHLYEPFKNNLGEKKLEKYSQKLEVGDKLNELKEA